MTNADRIQQMDECELADFLSQWATSSRAWQKDPGETLWWLRKPYDTEAGDEADGI